MAEISHDPLLPWLRSVKTALHDFNLKTNSESNIRTLVSDCIAKFKDDDRYRDDLRFLKIWFIHLGFSEDYGSVYSEMLEKKICVGHSMLYVWYGWFLEFEEKLYEAHMVYHMGIMRNAEPVEWLKKAQASFLDRMTHLANNSSAENVDDGESMESEESYVNPWSSSTMKELSRKTMKKILGYRGCHSSSKACPGKVAVSTVQNLSKKLLEIGRKKYQIKGCAGQGGFAQVYRAYVNSNSEDVVALKIQNPPFPWEFYMYRQLDHRIASEERQSFGFAHQMHLYSDCSILVCDFLGSGTLQDAINAYAVIGKSMEEVLCIYYTIEMLYMLEALHGASIIHGDFKPDNLLIRYARDDLEEDEFRSRSGSWRDQGLCLVDWGRGIDLSLFPDGTEFKGDCRTSGFRCIEMQCNRPWKFQVDTYGVCVIVHMMLHNQYMEIQEKALPDGRSVYLPKSTFRRYWNVDLWKNFFTKLLNYNNDDKELLRSLRESFQSYMCSNPQLLKKLKELLVKQRASLCSA